MIVDSGRFLRIADWVFASRLPRADPPRGFLASSREAALSPDRFFSRLPSGGIGTSLTFALLWGFFAYLVGGFWNFVVPGEDTAFLAVSLMFSPLATLANVLLVTLVAHLLVRRSIGGENAGWKATLQVCCYASVANVLCAIPFVGFFAAGLWFLFLTAAGIGRVHFEKASFVRLVGWVPLTAALVGFAVLKITVVAVLLGGMAGVVLTGTLTALVGPQSEALLSTVLPGAGSAYGL